MMMPLEEELAALGARWDTASLRIEHDDHSGERRVIALRSFARGEELASIDSARCLSPSTTTASGASAAKRIAREAARRCDGSWVPALSFALMYERSIGALSRWHGYVSSLPDFADVPSSSSCSSAWPRTLLRGTEAAAFTSSAESSARYEFASVIEPELRRRASSGIGADSASSHRYESSAHTLSIDAYLSARSIVLSRAFDIGGVDKVGLIPLLDLFNHRTTTPARRRRQLRAGRGAQTFSGEHVVFKEKTATNGSTSDEQPRRQLTLVAAVTITGGDEVFNSYGKLSNAKLLSQFGFTLPDNAYDRVALDASLVVGCAAIHGCCDDPRKRFRWCCSSPDGVGDGGPDGLSGAGDEAARAVVRKQHIENGFQIGWLSAEIDVGADVTGDDDSVDSRGDGLGMEDEEEGVYVSRTLLLLLLVLSMRSDDFDRCCWLLSEQPELTQEQAIISVFQNSRGASTLTGKSSTSEPVATSDLITPDSARLLKLCLDRREAAYFSRGGGGGGDGNAPPRWTSLDEDLAELFEYETRATARSTQRIDIAAHRRLHVLRVRTAERRLLASARAFAADAVKEVGSEKTEVGAVDVISGVGDDDAWSLFQ